MDRDPEYLLDILESIRLLQTYVAGVTMESFLQDVQLQDSVIRRIEVIGEAARRISLQTREKHPHLPWIEMIGMRNRMIHHYDDVDPLILWDTEQRDIPELQALIEPLVPPNEA